VNFVKVVGCTTTKDDRFTWDLEFNSMENISKGRFGGTTPLILNFDTL